MLNVSPVHLLNVAAARWPTKVALTSSSCNLTYSQLARSAAEVSGWLGRQGVEMGDRIVCVGANTVSMVAAIFGVLAKGAAVVPLHPQTPSPAAQVLIRDAEPKALCVDESLRLAFTDANFAPMLILPAEGVLQDLGGDKHHHETPAQLDPESIALLLYTSGSTGVPRAVVCPHANVQFVTHAIGEVLGYRSEDVVLSAIPFSFDYGLYQLFLAFDVGATIVLAPDISSVHLVPKLLADHNISVFPGNPGIFALLSRSRLLERLSLPKLRLITSTGEAFPETQIRWLEGLLPHCRVVPMYGLTECKRVSILPPSLDGRRAGTVGLPLPGTDVRIVDEKGSDVPAGKTGELVVRGPHVMAGYWRAQEDTTDRFRVDPHGSRELWTHDLFWRDDDGFLYFVDRSRSVMKSLGHRVSPAEVENILLHAPGVVEVAVVGVPDPRRGEAIVAFVVADGREVIAELEERCRLHLVPAARPVRFIVTPNLLPRTRHGKIDRGVLRASLTPSDVGPPT